MSSPSLPGCSKKPRLDDEDSDVRRDALKGQAVAGYEMKEAICKPSQLKLLRSGTNRRKQDLEHHNKDGEEMKEILSKMEAEAADLLTEIDKENNVEAAMKALEDIFDHNEETLNLFFKFLKDFKPTSPMWIRWNIMKQYCTVVRS